MPHEKHGAIHSEVTSTLDNFSLICHRYAAQLLLTVVHLLCRCSPKHRRLLLVLTLVQLSPDLILALPLLIQCHCQSLHMTCV
jgi:hypothetical protein